MSEESFVRKFCRESFIQRKFIYPSFHLIHARFIVDITRFIQHQHINLLGLSRVIGLHVLTTGSISSVH